MLDGRMLWNVVPKHHYAVHLGQQTDLINSRFVRTYQLESKMGVFQRMYRRSMDGPYSRVVKANVLFKHMLNILLQFSKI